MGNQILRISILTATYNAAEHLPHLITSLRAQTDLDFEWIVMDGGSQDDTVAQLRDASDVVSHWKSEPDFGIYDVLNKAIGMASGTYYVVIGADDMLNPTATGALFAALSNCSRYLFLSLGLEGGQVCLLFSRGGRHVWQYGCFWHRCSLWPL